MTTKQPMRVNILYPRVEGAVFDQQHWLDVHYPLVRNGIWAEASSVELLSCRQFLFHVDQ